MEAGKVLDACGHAPQNVCQQADGKQAYAQTALKGAETWVRLLRERWPKHWVGKYKDPVIRLHLALYGHPDCEKMLEEVGFELVFPAAWPPVFYHKGLQLLLAIYVDDFKMVGCQHVSRDSAVTKQDHPFAHVFDKSIPDPAANPANAGTTQDYTEVFPEEGVLVRHHLQSRKILYRPSKESGLMQLGEHRRTQACALSGGTQTEAWDSASHGSTRSELWTGSTYLVSNEHDKQSAVAAVAKANDRNKNDAKQ